MIVKGPFTIVFSAKWCCVGGIHNNDNKLAVDYRFHFSVLNGAVLVVFPRFLHFLKLISK